MSKIAEEQISNDLELMSNLFTTVQGKKKRDWDHLSQRMHLKGQPALLLKNLINDVVFDLSNCAAIQINQKPRKDLVVRLKNISKHLVNLDAEITRGKKDLKDILPWDLSIELTKILSLEAMEHAVGGRLPTWFAFEEGGKLKINEAEREPFAITQGVTLLQYTIASLKEPIDKWLSLNRLNKGGRRSMSYRAYLLEALALCAREITGKQPKKGTTGPFVELCSAVIDFVGLPDDGIAKAADKVIKKLCTDGVEL